MKEILSKVEGVELKERHGGKFYYRLHLTPKMSETTIESLDLSVRSYNSLKRAGFHSLGELAESISGGQELRHIRNCGAKSVREIMEKLFVYQYNVLSPERQLDYLKETVQINQKKRGE